MPAQKSRRLQYINHLGHLGHIVCGMDIRQNWQLQLFAHPSQYRETRLDAQPAKAAATRSVGLVVAAFENQGDAQIFANFLQMPGHIHLQLFAFNHTGAGNQKKRLPDTDFESAQVHTDSSV